LGIITNSLIHGRVQKQTNITKKQALRYCGNEGGNTAQSCGNGTFTPGFFLKIAGTTIQATLLKHLPS